MGVTTKAVCYLGWKVRREVLVDWLQDRGVSSKTIEDYGIVDSLSQIDMEGSIEPSDTIEAEGVPLPRGWQIDSTCPEYDLPDEEQEFHFCLISLVCFRNISLMQQMLNDSELEMAKILASQWKCKGTEPYFYAAISVS